MQRQILVRVKNISKDDYGHPTELHGVESVITYKAYLYTQDKYELMYQCDEKGNQVFDAQGNANPNLKPEHRQQTLQKSAVHAADVRGENEPVLTEQPKRRGRRPNVELKEETA
jgi:hypothetical protein